MNAITGTVLAGLPPLSPVELEMIRVLSQEAYERNVAREMAFDVPELRRLVKKLARRLDLPLKDTPEAEFSQMQAFAHDFQKSHVLQGTASTQGRSKASAAWELKLQRIAAAVAKGTLVEIDPYKIRPMHGQPRDYFPSEEQSSLEDSLLYVGQVQDIIIRKRPPRSRSAYVANAPTDGDKRVWRLKDTEYEICDGERRWRAALSKGLLAIRAKLIDVDDEGAYLVAAVSNFNRAQHTTIERARSIEQLMRGDSPLPIEVICAMQGISKTTADKLLQTLKLPEDVREYMDVELMAQRGLQPLGKVPSYEVARLAGNPKLHDHARGIANRYVRREINLSELKAEVDKTLSKFGTRDVESERLQPARRLVYVERKVSVIATDMRDVRNRLQAMKDERVLPARAKDLHQEINRIAGMAEDILKLIGAQRPRE